MVESADYLPVPLTFTTTVRCSGSLLVIVSVARAGPFSLSTNCNATLVEPCGLTMNSPPFTTNGAPCVGTAASIATVPAFLIWIVCDFDTLPTATLPNLIDFGFSFNFPPFTGVAVEVGVGVLVVDAVAVAVDVAATVIVGVAVAVPVADAVGAERRFVFEHPIVAYVGQPQVAERVEHQPRRPTQGRRVRRRAALVAQPSSGRAGRLRRPPSPKFPGVPFTAVIGNGAKYTSARLLFTSATNMLPLGSIATPCGLNRLSGPSQP